MLIFSGPDPGSGRIFLISGSMTNKPEVFWFFFFLLEKEKTGLLFYFASVTISSQSIHYTAIFTILFKASGRPEGWGKANGTQDPAFTPGSGKKNNIRLKHFKKW